MHRAIAALALVLAPIPAAAQGVVRGTVHDTKGTPISSAKVEIFGTTLRTRTDAAGRFRLTLVPAGRVRVRAGAIGHAMADTVVSLTGGDSTSVEFMLADEALALEPVHVVDNRVQHFGDRPATSVADITERDIDRRAVNTVEEALDHVAGVQMIGGQTNVRGSTGYVQGLNSRVLMTVDGIPMNQGDRGGINWDLLAVDEIEGVQILKGAGSSLYGSAALGGVINVTTRDIPNGLHTRLRLTGGMYADPPHAVWQFRDMPGLLGSADVAASYGNDLVGGRIAAGDRHSDGYRQQDQEDHLHFAAKARWKSKSNNTRVDVSGAWAADRYDVPLAWCNRAQCADRGQVFQPFMIDTAESGARTDSRKAYVAAQVNTTISSKFAWSARGSWFRTHFIDLRRSASEFGISNRFGIAGQIDARPDTMHAVVVGAEATFSNVSSDIFGDHTQSELAAYGQSEQRIGALRVSGGARVDFLAVDGGSLTAVLSPRIGFSLPTDHREHDGGTLRASIGRGFRAPTMAERFVHTFFQSFEVVPNPTLRPETAWSLEIGHQSPPLFRLMRLDAALFWTQAHDLIEPQLLFIPPDTVRIQLQNVVRARIAGFDASLIAEPREHLITTLGYTYLDTRRRLAGDSTEGPLAFRPRHLVTFGADYTWRDFGLGLDFRFASRPERIELEGFVDPRRVPVKVLDVRASWKRGPVELRLLAANVLNYIYNLVPETLAPVRTLTFTAVWSH
jgi:iron complex outermembrane receptor protein